MVSLGLHIRLFCHLNHLHRLKIFRLSPLRESFGTRSSEEHVTDLCQFRILPSSQLLVPRKLPNVLEASLPN